MGFSQIEVDKIVIRFRLKSLKQIRALAGAVLVVYLMQTAIVYGQSNAAASVAITYSIPAGPLKLVLTQFAVRTGLSLAYPPNIVENERSNGVTGLLTKQQALEKLLDGTNLEAKIAADGNVSISRKAAAVAKLPTPQTEAPAPVPTITKQSNPISESPVVPTVLQRIEINGDHQTEGLDFVVDQSESASRITTPLSQIPQSVQVVNADQIAALQIHSVADALNMVGAVWMSPTTSSNNVGNAPIIRNFYGNVVINGLPSPIGTNLPIAAIDHIEVIKGADASLANNQSSPGGTVNLITKRPQATPLEQVSTELGSLGHLEMWADTTGKMPDAKYWMYRTVMSASRDEKTPDGYEGTGDFYLAPSIGYANFEQGTNFFMGLTYQESRYPPTQRTALITAQGAGAELNTSPWGRADDHTIFNDLGFTYDWRQTITKGFEFRSKGAYFLENINGGGWGCSPDEGMDGLLGNICNPIIMHSKQKNVSVESTLTWQTGENDRKNSFLLGVTPGYLSSREQEAGTLLQLNSWPPTNLSPLNSLTLNSSPVTSQATHLMHLFFADQLTYGYWHIQLGAGQNRISEIEVSPINGSDYSYRLNELKFGVLYDVTADLGFYVNIQRGAKLNSVAFLASVNGGQPSPLLLPPTYNVSQEAGAKWSLLDKNLLVNFSAYITRRTNVLSPAIGTNPLISYFTSIPGDESKGVELNVTGNVAAGLNITGNVTDSGYYPIPGQFPIPSGSESMPRLQAKLFMNYDFQNKAWQRFGVGLAFRGMSGFSAAYTPPMSKNEFGENVARFNSQFVADANMSYRTKNWTAILGVKNIFNQNIYIPQELLLNTISMLPARTWTLTFRYQFH